MVGQKERKGVIGRVGEGQGLQGTIAPVTTRTRVGSFSVAFALVQSLDDDTVACKCTMSGHGVLPR